MPRFSYISRKMLWLFAVFAAAIAVTAVILVLIRDGGEPEMPGADSDTLRFATGSKKGTYFKIGNKIIEAMQDFDPRIPIENKSSQGSIDNIVMLNKGEADIALAQLDIACDYMVHKKRDDYSYYRNIKAVTTVFTEQVHIIARKDRNIANLSHLTNIKIGLGPEGSGSHKNAVCILQANGIEAETLIRPLHLLKECLLSDSIGALIYTVGAPNNYIEQILRSDEVELIEIGKEYFNRIQKEFPEFIYGNIKSGTYVDSAGVQIPPEDIATVGIQAVLLCRNGLDKRVIRVLAHALFESRAIIKPYNTDRAFQTGGLPIEIHRGAREYYDDMPLGRLLTFIMGYLPFLGFLLFFIVLLFTLNRARWRRHSYVGLVRILVLIGCFWIIGAFLLHWFEKDKNENFISIKDSFWSMATYLLSGYEDKYPVTETGKWISIILITVGIGLMALFTGELASLRTSRKLREANYMIKQYGNHIVLINWNSKAERILKDIFQSGITGEKVVVLVEPDKKPSVIHGDEIHKRSEFVTGNVISGGFLREVSAHRARSIIILADERDRDPDAKSAFIALAIDSLCREQQKILCKGCGCEIDRPARERNLRDAIAFSCPRCGSKDILLKEAWERPRIIAEAIDHTKIGHLRAAGIDEVVCSVDYGIGVLAQSALYNRSSIAYHHLLEYSEDTAGIYELAEGDIPDDIWQRLFEGKTFHDAAAAVWDSQKDKRHPTMLIGVRRDGEVIINPRRGGKGPRFETFDDIRRDHPIFLSYRKPDLAPP
jgi:TRAP transporter TAXI family solute receptor